MRAAARRQAPRGARARPPPARARRKRRRRRRRNRPRPRRAARRLERFGVGDAGRLKISAHQPTRSSSVRAASAAPSPSRLAEHHVIGALLARGHRVVRFSQSRRPPRSARASGSRAPRQAHRPRPRHARRPRRARARAAGRLEEQRAIGRDRRLEKRRDDRPRLALGPGREADARARDRRGGQNLGEDPRESRRVRRGKRRREEIDRAGGRGEGRAASSKQFGGAFRRPMRPNPRSTQALFVWTDSPAVSARIGSGRREPGWAYLRSKRAPPAPCMASAGAAC